MGSDADARSQWHLAVGGILLGIGIGLAIFVGLNRRSPELPATQTRAPLEAEDGFLAPGDQAPTFELSDTAGGIIRLEDQRGKAVLINFWATWCAPCKVEMPALQRAFEDHHDRGFTILAVDFDEPAQDVQAFGEDLGLTFPLLLDPGGDVQNLYRVRGYPTSVFLDPSGVIRVYHIGVMSEGQLEGYLAELGFESS